MPCRRTGVSTRASLSVWSSTEPHAADDAVVLDADHEPVLARQVDEGGVDRLDPARVDDGDADPLGGEPVGHLDRDRGHRADPDDEHVLGAVADQHVAAAGPVDRLDVVVRRALGEPYDGRGVVDLDGLPEQLAQPGAVARGGEPQPRDDLEHRHVPHAVVAGAVVAGHAGPVEHEGDAAPVQRDVHQHLVERTVEEGGVDRDHRVQAAHREARRRGGRVLLGDADVEGALGVLRGEQVQPDRVQHRGGDRDEVLALAAERDHLVGEHVGPDPALGVLLAGLHVERSGRVELVGLVALGGVVAEALPGHHVHDHRAVEPLRLGERLLDGAAVVAVDRADVLQPEVLEEPLRRERVLHALLDRVQRVVDGGPDAADAVEPLLHQVEHLLVARAGAQRGQVVGEAADGRACRSGRCR